MGAEAEQPLPPSARVAGRAADPPAVLGLQVSALIDHVARVDWSLLDRVPGDRGGSQQVRPCPWPFPLSTVTRHHLHTEIATTIALPFVSAIIELLVNPMCSCNSRWSS